MSGDKQLDNLANKIRSQVNMPQADTEYNRKMQQESLLKQENLIRERISKVESDIKLNEGFAHHVINIMDLMEAVIRACGGEDKLEFLDVSYDMVRAKTRVPMDFNLFPFKGEEDNIRFHKVVIRILLQVPEIHGVRWIPTEDRGSYIIVSLKK